MRISVTHSTLYRYDFPVYLEPHIFRFRTRTNSAQKLLTFNLHIAPTPAEPSRCRRRETPKVDPSFASRRDILSIEPERVILQVSGSLVYSSLCATPRHKN